MSATPRPLARRAFKWLAWAGLCACLGLAFWVEWQIWLTGVGILMIGLVWHALMRVRQRT